VAWLDYGSATGRYLTRQRSKADPKCESRIGFERAARDRRTTAASIEPRIQCTRQLRGNTTSQTSGRTSIMRKGNRDASMGSDTTIAH